MDQYAIWSGLPLGLAGFALYVGALAAILRRPWALPSHAATATALSAYAIALAAALAGRHAVNFWSLSIFFWFPTLVFLMGFGAVYKSISLRILLRLLERPGHAEDYAAVLARYVTDESFESRLKVMEANGFAQFTPGGYALTEKGRRLAQTIDWLQRLFAIKQSG
jgi:hypothetical protein